jgi:trans-2,3-dihydro-3-hydroxyanthranilate isomerase
VPLKDRETVDRASADGGAMRALGANIFLFAISPPGSTETIYSRMFGAGVGIVEDAATGSACGPAGAYLVRHGLVKGDAAGRIVNLQGVAMHRPSVMHIAISGTPDAITEVKVGGEAVLVAKGELLV